VLQEIVGVFRDRALIHSKEAGTQDCGLFYDAAVQSLENDGHEIVALRAFDLLEGLDVVVLGPVHDREYFGHEMGFISRPMTASACIEWLHNDSLGSGSLL
jgi:hypothetical protein